MEFRRVALVIACSLAISVCASIQSSAELNAECGNLWPGWKVVKYWFSFGDSYTQTGFNVSGTQPSIGNPLGNPPYPGWTSANGPNWVDYLTTKYNASQLLTYNVADGGATVDADLVKPYTPSVASLKDQVQKRFLPTYGKKPASAPWTAGDSLFSVWIGINDVANLIWDGNYDRMDKVFGVYRSLIEEMYQSGARNFLFLDVPPIDRSPQLAQLSNAAQAVPLEEKGIAYWNSKVVALANTFQASHSGVTTTVFSTNKLYRQILDNPAVFPQTALLKNTKDFCSGYSRSPPSISQPANGCNLALGQYFWLNNLHPTFPVHDATAAELSKHLSNWPANVGKKCSFVTQA